MNVYLVDNEGRFSLSNVLGWMRLVARARDASLICQSEPPPHGFGAQWLRFWIPVTLSAMRRLPARKSPEYCLEFV